MGIPYPIFTYTALLPWELFVSALNIASRSLVQNANMVTKVYFPRMILPLAAVLAGLVDFFFAFLVLIGMMVFYHIRPGPAGLDSAFVYPAGIDYQPGSGSVAVGAECALPGYRLYSSLFNPVLAVHHPDCLSGQHDPGEVETGCLRLIR